MEDLIDAEELRQKEKSSTSEDEGSYHSAEETETDTTATETEIDDQIPDSYPPCGQQPSHTSTPQLDFSDIQEMEEKSVWTAMMDWPADESNEEWSYTF